jgi:ATP-dependent helicase/nuclease subunit A
MGEGTLTIYSASAGSGKTFKLAGVYLARLFKSKYNYRKILAVTFTNKATAEMKSRILDQLHFLAKGDRSEYLDDLIKATGKTEEALRIEAGEILFSILHDFSRFSVCTIDTFFQKVLRAFARESGLQSGFNIELDHSMILSSAVDQMIASSSDDARLKNWLNEYVFSNLDEEKSWNLKREVLKLGEELFKEKFKILSTEEISNLGNKEFLLEYISSIRTITASFRSKMMSLGGKCMEIYSAYELTDDMFYQKGKGIPGFIRNLALGKLIKPNNYVMEILNDPPKWSTGEPCSMLRQAIERGLDSALQEAIGFYDENIIFFNSANAILSNIYALGILSDVLSKVRSIANSENSFLISDAGEFLSLITKGDQTPFIYEKIGNRYENYMIDEFQDTSILQWGNFEPLIINSMGEGYDNLVVGDVKQSIYRFRNSDWQILGKMQDELIDNQRFLSEPLKTNFRSRSNIIRFNNSLFSVIPELVDSSFTDDPQSLKFNKLYSGAVQADPGRRAGGFVRLEFIDDIKNDEDGNEGGKVKITKKWKDIVIEKLPHVIETFQDRGYSASDIGILVRDGREGAEVLETMIRYNNTCPDEKRIRYNYNIISNDSLIISNSPAVIFIIAVLKVLNDPADMIARAQMLRFYLLAIGNENAGSIPLFSDRLVDGTDGYLPEAFGKFLERAGKMTLFEVTENIISFFGLGRYPWNVSYLNTFQDWVLNYSVSKNSDFESFLEWWDSTGKSKSVVLPSNQDAAKVFTIHKSKGLEFRVVIIPFLSWNLDHKSTHHPVLWLKPEVPPFNGLGIVPVRYQKGLVETIFADEYRKELYSAYLDNINLLYVAMTRAIDAIYGFVPETPGPNNGIARLIKDAISSEESPAGDSGVILASLFDKETLIFESGEIPIQKKKSPIVNDLFASDYIVSRKPGSLRLKLHGENYFTADREAVMQRINYGRLMHEVFEEIDTYEDIPDAVESLVLEGKIPAADAESLISRLQVLLSVPGVYEWFSPGYKVLKEAEILLPSGIKRRPDRIIFKNGKAVIIDFKFGEENHHYTDQLRQYKELLKDMGYSDTEAFLWYVDLNKTVSV